MLTTLLTLFTAGLLTILLPCILPLIPIVLGVSIVDKNRWKPLVTVAGMLVSFVGFTFLLQVVLSQFVELAEYIRIATFYILLLFGCGFLTHRRSFHIVGALAGSVFFLGKGWVAVFMSAFFGILSMMIGSRVAARIQQVGSGIQGVARTELGANSLFTAFIIGLTMGLVWVPCAGPALGFALSVVRDEPGVTALFYLTAYGVGAGIPLLLIGYGGQRAVYSVRWLTQYSGRVKQVSGILLILSAIGFQLNVFQDLQTWFVNHTSYGTLGTRIEEKIVGGDLGRSPASSSASSAASTTPAQNNNRLPFLSRAPSTLPGLSPWHNTQPLDMASLRGKVVLIDFWTYSCINCIRTLPYMEALWQKHKEQPFILLGVHAPEFIFEKSEENVARSIQKYSITYPVAQDNDFSTWRAFQNRYWPAHYLIDADGNLRYTHFGEGAYEETDAAVTSLLEEIGSTTKEGDRMDVDERTERKRITPETYLHSRSWKSFGNALGQPDDRVHEYQAPDALALHQYYLDGRWQLVDDERQVLLGTSGDIRLRALAGEAHLVLGLEDPSEPVLADVFVDGIKQKTITIQGHDLYTLFKGSYGEHDIVLKLRGSGVAAYAFTFGS